MSKQRNCYEVMGLPPEATMEQVKKKYRELALKFHPDVAQNKALGLCVFMQISQAYYVLGSPERRAVYNVAMQNAALDAVKAADAVKADAVKAADAVKKAVTSPAQPFAELLNRAESALLSGRPVEAQEFCLRVLGADPNQAQAIALFGDALARMGRSEEAAIQYRRALHLSPSVLLQAKLNRIVPGRSALHLAPTPSVNTECMARKVALVESKRTGSLFGRFLSRK